MTTPSHLQARGNRRAARGRPRLWPGLVRIGPAGHRRLLSPAAPPAPLSHCSRWPASDRGAARARARRVHAAGRTAVARIRAPRLPAASTGPGAALPTAAAERALDVYHRRTGGPRADPGHFHGGGFYSGSKAREARPLIRHLTHRRGFVCGAPTTGCSRMDTRRPGGRRRGAINLIYGLIAAGMRQLARCSSPPTPTTPLRQPADLGAAASRPDHSASSQLLAAPARAAGAAGPGARLRERVRAVSSHPVLYAELPGAHHDFDLFESIRSAAVNQAVEQFTAGISTSPSRGAGADPCACDTGRADRGRSQVGGDS